MKITASRRDDILRERDAYLADKASRQARYDEQQGAYAQASKAEFDAVEAAIRKAIGNTSIDYDVRVERALSFREMADNLAELEVVVSSEKDIHAQPFSWRWQARIRDGELKKESSSWSGMNVTTDADVQYMREVIRILETLIHIDWESLLIRAMPRYSDYITEKDPRYEKAPRNYDQELKEVELEDAVGQDILFAGRPFDSNSFRRIWYKIFKITPSQVQVVRVPDAYVQQGPAAVRQFVSRNPYIERVSKDKLYPRIDVNDTYDYHEEDM